MKVQLPRLAALLPRMSRTMSIFLGFAYLAALAIVDHATPILMSFTPFYIIGLAFLGWNAGFWPAAVFSLISSVVTGAQDYAAAEIDPNVMWIVFMNAACRFVVFAGVGWLTMKLSALTRRLSNLVEEQTHELLKETAQHKATSERLAQANERFLQVINNIEEVFWLVELPDFRVIYASPAYERVWGRPVDELYRDSKSWLLAVHPDDRAELIRRIPVEQPVGGYDVEYRITRPDGTLRWIRDRAFPVRNASGETIRVTGLAQDITEQKRTEEVLQTQAAILENMAEAVIVTDKAGTVVQMNPAAERIWGIKRAEILGQPASTFSGRSGEESTAIMQGVLAELESTGGWHGTFHDLRRDGTSIICEAHVTRLEVHGRILNVSVEQEVTQRVHYEEQLQMQARVLASMAEAVVMVDESGIITLTNPAGDALLGYDRDELVGQPLYLVAAMPIEEYQALFAHDFKEAISGGSIVREYPGRRKDGSTTLLEVRASAFRVNTRHFLVLVGQDITERKQAGEALARQEQLYRTLFELCPNGILVEDTQGNVLDVNRAICETLGYARSELLGQNVRVFAAADSNGRVEANLAAIRAGQALDHEVWNVQKNGGRRLMRLNEKPIALPDGRQAIMVVASDVTELRQDERTREALLALGTKLSIARTPLEAAQAMFASADQLWEWHSATLDIYNPETDRMQHVLNYDIVDGQRREVPAVRPSLPPTPRMRRVMQSGPELVSVSQQDNLHARSMTFGDTARRSASIMCVPLRRDGNRVGVLSLQSYAPNAYNEEDLRKLQALADYCGSAFDRIQAEEALRESEDRYRTLAESSPDAIFILDRDITVRYVNSTASALWGRQPKELLGRSQADLFPPETARRQSDVVAKVLQTGEILHRDVEIPYPGGPRWQETRLAPMRGADGHINSVMGISRDITERKRAEQRLAEALDLNQKMIAASSVGIAAFKASGQCVFANAALATITRRTTEDLLQQDFRQLTFFQQAGLLPLAEKVLEQGHAQRADFYIPSNSGDDVWGECHLTAFTSGGDLHLLFMLHDLSRHKRAEKALRQSEERYRTVVEDQTEIISRFTPDGVLTFVNEVYCRFFGGQVETTVGKNWKANVPPEELRHIEENLERLTPTAPAIIIENSIVSPSGQRHWMQFANRALFDDRGRLMEIQSVGRDITERKRAEEALRESESKLSAVFKILPVGISIVSQDGKIKDLNPALCRFLGVTPDALVKREDMKWKFFRHDGKPLAGSDVPSQRAIREQAEVLDSEIGIQKESGERIWVSVNASPLPGIGAVVSTVDITERKRAEFLLRAQKDLAAGLSSTSDLKTAAECLLEITLQLEGIDCGCISLFDSTTGVLDLTAQQGLPNGLVSGIAPFTPQSDEARKVEKGLPVYFDATSAATWQQPFRLEEGLRATAIIPLSHAGTLLGVMNLFSRGRSDLPSQARRIIETLADEAAGALARIRVEEALHQSEARLRAFITAAPVLLFACDRDGVILLEDGLALKTLGVEPGERVGQSVFQVFAANQALLDNVRRALKGEEFSTVIEIGLYAFDCWYSPVRDKFGQVAGFNGVATNVTERYRLERQILEISDREQARIGQDIHDGLCQQLVTLAFDANSLQDHLSRNHHSEAPRAGRIAGFLDEAITEARHLARGLFPVRLESEGLSPALQELANTTRSRFKVQCRFRSRGKVGIQSSVVATHLYRIAQESVNNAIRHGKAKTIIINLNKRADELELQITDDGTGFTAKTSAGSARGMGLHIMDYRARALGGILRFQPGPDRGTTISCCIPRPVGQYSGSGKNTTEIQPPP